MPLRPVAGTASVHTRLTIATRAAVALADEPQAVRPERFHVHRLPVGRSQLLGGFQSPIGGTG